MSVYQLNKILYLLDVDENFLALAKKDPADAIKNFDLADDERNALLKGDVGQLYLWGVHTFILNSTARHEVFGISRDNYLKRLRAATKEVHSEK